MHIQCRHVQLTTSSTDFFVVAQMSVDLVGFVNLVGVGFVFNVSKKAPQGPLLDRMSQAPDPPKWHSKWAKNQTTIKPCLVLLHAFVRVSSKK